MNDQVPIPKALELIHDPVICWAAEHCGIPMIRGCRVANTAESDLTGAQVEITLLPDLGEALVIHLPTLAPGESFALGRVDYRLPPGRLRQVVELERGEFRIRLLQGNGTLGEERSPVDVLPCHQWPGLRLPPGLLTSFITPNHPVITQILKRTSDRLREVEGSAAITGYQAKTPTSVRAQAVALFQSFQSLGLNYIGMPASFEQEGQKIRFPDMILRDQMANCLDLTLLTAGCLEQMALRPLVIFIEGHAFPGVWLVEDRFPEGVVEDAARLRNLLALGQILVWDSSATLEQPPVSFAQVQAIAERNLASDEKLQLALDVRVMRLERFLPLPLRDAFQEPIVQSSGAGGPIKDELREILAAAVREGARSQEPAVIAPPAKVAGRWQRWKDRLLDLSLRNRLLNFKPAGALALPLEVPDASRFEDLLADNKVFDLLPKPPQDSRDERDLRLLAQREDAEAWKAQRMVDLNGRILHSSLTPGDFTKRAKDLETQARIDLEEGGVCTVFVAVGLLRWFEPGDSKERFAPLLLYPVQILFNRQLRRVCLQRLPEDPIPNVTLVEKMRRDFQVDLSFMAALEPDDSGVDIPLMLRQCREAIQRIPRWEVLEEIHLGHFTFAKFLMWKDLEDNAEMLLKSAVVHHLASDEGAALANQPEAITVETLETMSPGQLPCVLDADSTQLSAAASALSGRSFVLQGPPGTGKSQTIANIIACALANNRSVLFVSEKMAALEVVYSRLRQVGLGDFCLELHSHKVNRKAVLESFQTVLERTSRVALEGWESREAELQQSRSELNSYSEALHRRRPIGFSLFEGSSRSHVLRRHPALSLHQKDPGNLEAEPYRQLLLEVETFAHRAEAVGVPANCSWIGTDPAPWTYAAQESLDGRLRKVREALWLVRDSIHLLAKETGLELPLAPEALEALVRVLAFLDDHQMPEAALDPNTWEGLEEELGRYQSDSKALARRQEGMALHWTPRLLEQDLGSLLAVYQQHANTFPLIRWIFLWGAAGQLKPLSHSGLQKPHDVLRDLGEAMAIQQERHRLQDIGSSLMRRLKPAPWNQTESLLPQVTGLHQAMRILQIHMAPESASALLHNLWRLPVDRRHVHRERLGLAFEEFQVQDDELNKSIGLKRGQGAWDCSGASYLDQLDRQLDAWAAGIPMYKAWCFYRESGRNLESMGLPEVVEAHRSGVATKELLSMTERAILERWCAAIRDKEPALRGFEGSHHHRKVSKFRELDQHWIQLSRAFVVRQLEARLPLGGAGVSENSEMGTLLRETKKKTRHMAVRRLLKAIPTLRPRLKPCLLMSPLSVAQFLPAEGKPFDLLIFDEASQITTHDAIGALARGSQVIVVGDSKQLPPTSFFTRNLDEEGSADDNDVTELESILDEAVAKQFPQQLLGWHYRSRHQALIDFSNQKYYDNRLHVFPAAARRVVDLGIAWHPVPEGVYFSSGCEPRNLERTNPREAERLVEHLVQSLRNTPVGKRTFGIVTFSMSQQKLIQELLDEQRARFPEIEGHFQCAEPVFIKNLENVQGDERDEILFSIGYAKDHKGRLRMHFGPLSVSGGERRLNVAITRARCQLRVFSTLTHDQIDLSRTAARGAEHLRAFLQYAAHQGASGPMERPVEKFPSAFEREIAAEVEEMGYEVHTQIGCGGYRIDLAVVDPTQPGRYLLGIECDGPSYHSAPAARDRDRLRHQVLEGLGWHLHRVWSPDWVDAHPREMDRLREALETARQPQQGSKDGGSIPLVPIASIPPGPAPAEGPRQMAFNAAPAIALPAETPNAPTLTRIPTLGTIYVEASLAPITADDPEVFYAAEAQPFTLMLVKQILASEAPIHRNDLDGKIVRSWGWSALTRRGRTHMDAIIARMASVGEVRCQGEFVWRADQDPSTHEGFRTPGTSGPRDADRIPPEEIANAMAAVLQANIAMEEEPMLKETARILGYVRVSAKTMEALKAGLNPLLQRSTVQREAGVIKQV
jgi:very-short-patch-repair endonuclease